VPSWQWRATEERGRRTGGQSLLSARALAHLRAEAGRFNQGKERSLELCPAPAVPVGTAAPSGTSGRRMWSPARHEPAGGRRAVKLIKQLPQPAAACRSMQAAGPAHSDAAACHAEPLAPQPSCTARVALLPAACRLPHCPALPHRCPISFHSPGAEALPSSRSLFRAAPSAAAGMACHVLA